MEEVDRILRCEIMFPEALTTTSAEVDAGEADLGEPGATSNRLSVGVGGVMVVRGVLIMREGGVKGRREFSRLGIEWV